MKRDRRRALAAFSLALAAKQSIGHAGDSMSRNSPLATRVWRALLI